MTNEPEILASSPSRSRRPLVVAGVTIAAALAIGGGVAAAAAAPSPSGSPSASPSASGSAGPRSSDERQHTPHLAGTVVSVSGNTITITDREGFQRTIHTSGTTTYEDGLTAAPAAGTKIFATGTVDSDKVSLLATKISKAPERPAGDRGHRGGRGGHGGPGRSDDDDKGSTTTPTPSPSTPSASPTSPTPSASPTS